MAGPFGSERRSVALVCGSYGARPWLPHLHARHHADELAGASASVGYSGSMRPHESVIMGHEFVDPRTAAF